MFRKLKGFVFTTSLIFCLAVTGLSQETTGSIEGTVQDSTGALIPGATVVIEGNAFKRTVTTNEEGYYRVPAVPAGQYRLTASATNFSDSTPTTATVSLGRSTPIDFMLQPAGVGAEVIVTGDVAAIDPTSSRVQTNITEKRFEEIPKGNNFTSVLTTVPGVQNEPNNAGIQIDGSSGAENTFIIDGQEVTNFRTGQLNSNNNLPFELIEEVQIKSGGFAAEHGGATGGVITLVTKRGGNDFHGNIGTSFQTSALEPKSALVDPNAVTVLSNIENQNRQQSLVLRPSSTTLEYIRPPGDDYVFFFPSMSLGGPIIKDRLWFFGAYNLQSFDIERTVNYPNGQREVYRRNERRDYGFFRLDSQLGDTLNLTGSYTYNPIRVHGDLDAITGLASSVPTNGVKSGSEFLDELGGRRSSTTYNFGGTWTPNSNWIVSLRGGQSALNERLGSYGIPQIPRVRCILGNQNVPGVTPGGTCASGFSSIPTNFGTNRDISRRTTIDADSTVIFEAGGRHNLKFGYQLNRLSNDVDQGYVGLGEIRFFYGSSSRGFGVVDGGVGYVYVQDFGTVGKTSSKNQALYIQDSWTIGRLTINPGFRIEREDVPSFSATGIPLVFGWGDKPAPRIGAAYDVLGDGRWKIYGGYGWFYDRFKYELPRGSFGGDVFLRYYLTIPASNPDFNDPMFQRNAIINNPNNGVFNFRVPSNDPSDNRIDPDLKAARESSLDIGTEFELGTNLIVGARFVHKQIDRAIEDVGIFDAAGNELFFIANPGFGIVAEPLLPGVPPTPKAERKYDAIEFKVNKRFSDNYFFNANYTYSRLFGNYSGLASSDERGRSSPNVNRFFDIPFLGFDADGNPDNGRLATDRPHTFKVNAGYNFDWFGSSSNSTDLTTFIVAESGTPVSTRVSFFNANTFLNGRGDLGRTDNFYQTDVAVTHKYKFGRDARYTLAFNVDVLNLFNQNAVLRRFDVITPADFSDAEINPFIPSVVDETTFIQQIFNGGLSNTVKQIIGTQNAPIDSRFNQPDLFQSPRSIRFGVRLNF